MAALLEASVGRRVVVRYRKPQSLRAADSSDDSSAWSQSSRPLELLAVELAADPSAVKNTAAAAAATAADDGTGAVTRAAADSGSPVGVAPPDIASVVFLYSMCGYPRAIDEATFRALWFNTGRTRPNDYTMQNYIQKCSFGRSKLTNSTQLVFEVDEQAAWSQAAEELVQRQWGIDLTPYKQRIGVLPNEVSKICGFGGRGSVGCAERCYTWITHDYASNLVYFLHEMGHNWGLRHATAYDSASATGDWSCIMGTAGACLNAANGWKMGWALPLPGADLDGSTMPPGMWLPYFVPYQSTAHASHVRIYPSWPTQPSTAQPQAARTAEAPASKPKTTIASAAQAPKAAVPKPAPETPQPPTALAASSQPSAAVPAQPCAHTPTAALAGAPPATRTPASPSLSSPLA
ncbi:hypothetical protein HYH03_005182 [Edaphochlamys debaryana]|uniref:Peptidase M11 gametolysin domain-containing protein n=1 Tax=Edaphochlamys debaryana TaxID=47281 RepID=A0A835YFR6_9CHLO|nr:hypothetical protein HYH03_005182 [Edaphochlamys debaryana]|eukprot:KAG2496774.1 hypothetical protein HYH03_005182 [Edaphochlamys debaryana]